MTERIARGLVIGTLVVLALITGALYVSADDNPVLHVCHEMGVQVADASLTETAQELAADAQPDAATGIQWRVEGGRGAPDRVQRGCRYHADELVSDGRSV